MKNAQQDKFVLPLKIGGRKMRIADKLQINKDTILKAYTARDQAGVAERADALVAMVIENHAWVNLLMKAYEKRTGLSPNEAAVDVFGLFGGLPAFTAELQNEIAKLSKGYKFEEVE